MNARQPSAASPILVLKKVTQVLNCFTVEEPDPTLQQLIRATGLPSSTCQRLVQNMVREGFLDRDGDRYRIGIGMVRWATPGTIGLDVVRLIRPILQDLRDETGETACFYMRDGAFRTVVAVAETRHVVMRPFRVGQVMPLYAGAPGKVFLAFDPESWTALKDAALVKFAPATPDTLEILRQQSEVAHKQGFYAAFGERHEDVGSVSAPVFDHTRNLIGALGLGFPIPRITAEDAPRLGQIVARAAMRASEALGYSGPLSATS